jgi:alkaline phosphatase
LACHDYDVDRVMRQTLLFDLTVKEAIDFAIKDKHTFVIVTADHETAGLTINEAGSGKDLELLWAVDRAPQKEEGY